MVTENKELEKEISGDFTKDENSTATDDINKEQIKNIFELSHTPEKDITKYKSEEITKYIYDYYLKNTEFGKDNVSNDLIAFKSYRDKIEIKLNNLDAIDRLFDKIMLFCSINCSDNSCK